jgi:hypothetical protein
MRSSDTLILLANEVRGGTLQMLDWVSDERKMLWSPPGTQNHIAWHAGHILWLADVLCIEPATGRSELPAGWADTFGMNCRPPSQTTSWPDRAELVARLTEQLPRIEQTVGVLGDADLQRIVPPNGKHTLARLIVHGFHDEASHQGEIYLLLKLQRRRPT